MGSDKNTKILIKRGSNDILTKNPSDRGELVFLDDKKVYVGLGNGSHVFVGGETGRKLKLSGDVTGEVGLDGSSDITLSVTVADNSHDHTMGNVTGLNDALAGMNTTLSGKLGKDDNAVSASKLQTGRNISLSGMIEGTGVFNGGSDIEIEVDIVGGVCTGPLVASANTASDADRKAFRMRNFAYYFEDELPEDMSTITANPWDTIIVLKRDEE